MVVERRFTRFGRFLVDLFDTEERMSPQEKSDLNLKLFCEKGITLRELDSMSIKDIDRIAKNKRFQKKYLSKKQ